jgi:hypothetical protein
MTQPIHNLQKIKFISIIIPLSIFIVALVARIMPGARTIDDAYITFRYARNLLSGYGFVYNPGEQVLGTTTPLYTGVISFVALFFGREQAPFPAIALILNAIADGITCLLLMRLGNLFNNRIAGVGAALVWAIAPYSVTFAIGGLETSLYVLLLVAVIYAHIKDKHIMAAFLGAFAILTRPDAVILIGPIGLDRLIQVIRERGMEITGQKSPSSASTNVFEIAAFLIPIIAWISFASIYFGSPIPHSIAAKGLAYHLPPLSAFIRLLQHYATPFLEQLTLGNWWIGVGIVLYPFLYLIGGFKAWRSNQRIWPLVAYPILYFATFAIANPLIFRWYLTPPMPAYFFFILTGVGKLLEDIFNLPKQFPRIRTSIRPSIPPSRTWLILQGCLIILAPLLFTLRGWDLRPDHGPDRPAPNMAWFKLELLYKQAAEVLAPEMRTHPYGTIVLAAGDVGVLGYFTPARILDTVGLNSPESSDYYPLEEKYYASAYAIPPSLILDKQPDYIVILEIYGREGLLKNSQFWQEYAIKQIIPTDIYNSNGLLILEKLKPKNQY